MYKLFTKRIESITENDTIPVKSGFQEIRNYIFFYKKVPSDIHLQIFLQKGSKYYKQNIITKINSILM